MNEGSSPGRRGEFGRRLGPPTRIGDFTETYYDNHGGPPIVVRRQIGGDRSVRVASRAHQRIALAAAPRRGIERQVIVDVAASLPGEPYPWSSSAVVGERHAELAELASRIGDAARRSPERLKAVMRDVPHGVHVFGPFEIAPGQLDGRNRTWMSDYLGKPVSLFVRDACGLDRFAGARQAEDAFGLEHVSLEALVAARWWTRQLRSAVDTAEAQRPADAMPAGRSRRASAATPDETSWGRFERSLARTLTAELRRTSAPSLELHSSQNGLDRRITEAVPAALQLRLRDARPTMRSWTMRIGTGEVMVRRNRHQAWRTLLAENEARPARQRGRSHTAPPGTTRTGVTA